MKKSKIIGLSLGVTALASVAVATPFLVTSCSSSISNNLSTTAIKSSFISALTPGAELLVGSNSATIYTGEQATIKFDLSTKIDEICSSDELSNIDTTSAIVTWEAVENSDYKLSADGKFELLKKLEDSTDSRKKVIQINLVANVKGNEKQENPTTPDQGTNDSEQTQTDASETEYTFNKSLNIKLFISFGTNPKAEK